MNLQKLIDRVKSFCNGDKESSVFSLLEEAGEVSEALNIERGTKRREAEETVPQEAVDCLAVLLEIWVKYNWTEKDVKSYLDKKLAKWQNSLENAGKA